MYSIEPGTRTERQRLREEAEISRKPKVVQDRGREGPRARVVPCRRNILFGGYLLIAGRSLFARKRGPFDYGPDSIRAIRVDPVFEFNLRREAARVSLKLAEMKMDWTEGAGEKKKSKIGGGGLIVRYKQPR